MNIEFTDKFKIMYNENVPRIKLKTKEEKDLVTGEGVSDKLIEDGFVKRLGQEKYTPISSEKKTNSNN